MFCVVFFPQSYPNKDHELNLLDSNIVWIRVKFSHSERNRHDLFSSNTFDKQRPSCMISTPTKNIKRSLSLLKIPFSVNQPAINPARRNHWSDASCHTACLFWKCMWVEPNRLLSSCLHYWGSANICQYFSLSHFPFMFHHLNEPQLASMYPGRKYLCW